MCQSSSRNAGDFLASDITDNTARINRFPGNKLTGSDVSVIFPTFMPPRTIKRVQSAKDIRTALVDAAREYERVTGTAFSAIGKRAINDPSWLFRVEGGKDFRMESYRRVTEWLKRNWPTDTVRRPSE